jgi:phosphoribosylanthranilate isomerase
MCGTTRLEDAEAAVRFGVDALGFILYDRSPRFIAPEEIKEICDRLPPFVDRVGVVVNEELDRVVSLAEIAGFSHLQLHGEESARYCDELRERLPCIKLLKAFRVDEFSTGGQFSPYENSVDGFLLDTHVKGEKGGTGKTFDWSIIKKIKLALPVILAGGLNVENINAAIAAVRPYAVDINSGVENAPGIKDHALLKKVIERIISGQ